MMRTIFFASSVLRGDPAALEEAELNRLYEAVRGGPQSWVYRSTSPEFGVDLSRFSSTVIPDPVRPSSGVEALVLTSSVFALEYVGTLGYSMLDHGTDWAAEEVTGAVRMALDLDDGRLDAVRVANLIGAVRHARI